MTWPLGTPVVVEPGWVHELTGMPAVTADWRLHTEDGPAGSDRAYVLPLRDRPGMAPEDVRAGFYVPWRWLRIDVPPPPIHDREALEAWLDQPQREEA